MRKFLLLSILISFTGYAQELKYGNGGRVLDSANHKINSIEVRELMKDNPVALNLFNVGRRKKSFGNALFYGGIGLAAINLTYAVFRSPSYDSSKGYNVYPHTYPTMSIIGGVMVLASIPIKSGYTKKVKTSIDEYNKDIVYQPKFNPNISVLADSKGLGVRIGF